MQIKNAKRWSPLGSQGYIFALIGVFVAFCIRYSLHGFLQASLPMTFFIANTIIVALLYGFGPSLATVFLAIPLAFFFFVPPFDSYDLPTAQDGFVFVSYILIAFIAVGIIEWLQRARYRAVLLARVSDSRYKLLAQISSTLKRAQAHSKPDSEHHST